MFTYKTNLLQLTFGYAVSLFVGGLLGLNHVDPNTSTCFGLINAIGATYGAYQIHENPNEIKVAAFIASFNAIFLGLKAAKSDSTNPFCPAGILTLLSFGLLLKLLL